MLFSNIDHYEIITKIGKGKYSEVYTGIYENMFRYGCTD